jgi:hypothetical protein
LIRWSALTLIIACASGGCGPDERLDLDTLLDTGSRTLLYRFGGPEADDWAVMGDEIIVDFDGSGRLHVLDAANDRSFVVDRDGTLAWEYARSGRGPGELEGPVGLAVRSDGGHAIADRGNLALIAVSPTGQHDRNVPLDGEGGFPSGRLFSFGPEVVAALATDAYGLPDDHATVSVRAYALDGAGPRTILDTWRAPLPEGEAQSLTFGGRTLRIRAPGLTNLKAFWPTVRVAKVGERLAVTDSNAYRIAFFTPEGRPVATATREIQPLPVTADVEAAERGRSLEALDQGEGPRFMVSNSDGSAQAVDPEVLRGFMVEQIEAMTFWPEIPVVHRMLGSPDGVLWVQRSAADGAAGRIDWISDAGVYLGTLPAGTSFPAALGPGGLEAGIETDALGATYVSVWVRTRDETGGDR